MIYGNLKANARKKKPPNRNIRFGPFARGLGTVKASERYASDYCSELTNFVLVDKGIARTRPGLRKICALLPDFDEVRHIADIRVAGAWRTIISSYENSSDVSRVWYVSSGTGVKIYEGSGDRDIRLLEFCDSLIIFDGVQLKRWNGTDISLIYDDSTSPAGTNYQFNSRWEQDNSFIALGNGTYGVLYQFRSQDWEPGYKIPVTRFFATLSKVGDGYTGTDTVPVTLNLYRRLGGAPNPGTDTLIKSQTFIEYVASLSSVAMEYDIIVENTEIDPRIWYYVSLTYNNGDASNHVRVHCVLSDNADTGEWTTVYSAVTDKKPLFALRPGAFFSGLNSVFGITHDHRMFMIEGEDGDARNLWYSGVSDLYDWSGEDSGGVLETSQDIGAIAGFYENLWLFGTTRQPFLSRLTGDSPANYALTDSIQQVSGHYKSIVVVPDDIIFTHPHGTDSIRTMQNFGDVMAISGTNDLKNIWHEKYSEECFAEYEPHFGLVLLRFDDLTTDIYAIHTKTQTGITPVALWRFDPQWGGVHDQKITAMGRGDISCYIGTDHGEVFEITPDELTDNGEPVEFVMKTNYLSTRFGEMAAWRVNHEVFGKNGGTLDIRFYKNHERTHWHDISVTLPNIGDGDDPSLFFDREDINFNFRTLMCEICDIVLDDGPVFVGPITINAYSVGGF